MGGIHGAPCTSLLKKGARQQWESRNRHDWLVLGFTAEEAHRAAKFCQTERDTLIPILVDQGATKERCFLELVRAGVRVRRRVAASPSARGARVDRRRARLPVDDAARVAGRRSVVRIGAHARRAAVDALRHASHGDRVARE